MVNLHSMCVIKNRKSTDWQMWFKGYIYRIIFFQYTENDELSKKDKTAMRRFVGMAINNIVPLPMREDFLKNYTCSPPPVFMIIVSVLEVRSSYLHYDYGYTFRGSNSVIYVFASLLKRDLLSKKRICSSGANSFL